MVSCLGSSLIARSVTRVAALSKQGSDPGKWLRRHLVVALFGAIAVSTEHTREQRHATARQGVRLQPVRRAEGREAGQGDDDHPERAGIDERVLGRNALLDVAY